MPRTRFSNHTWAILGLICSMGLSQVGLAQASPVELVLQRGSQIEVSAVTFSPDGRVVASAGESETIRLWDRETGELVQTLPGHAERVVGLTFSPDGKLLASGGTDGSVKVWDYRTGRLLQCFTNHVGEWARRVAFAPDSRRVSAATFDGAVSIWDVVTGAVVLSLPVKAQITDVLFTPDGRSLVTSFRGNNTRIIQFWDAQTGAPGLRLVNEGRVASIAISHDGRRLAASGEGGPVQVWELPSGRELRRFNPPADNPVIDSDLSADGRTLVMSGEHLNSVWDVDSGEQLCAMGEHRSACMNIALSPDGREVASASGDCRVGLWDARTGKVRRMLPARPPDSPVTTIAFSPDGAREAVGTTTGMVRVWDARTGEFQHNLGGHEGAVLTMTFSPDSRWLYSGSTDRTMRAWDLVRGMEMNIQPVFDRKDPVGAVACGGAERLAATASGSAAGANLDDSIKLWGLQDDRPQRVLSGHTAGVTAIAYAPGVDQLVSVSADGTMKLWDTRQATCLLTRSEAVGVVNIAYAPDARSLAAAMTDGSVRVLAADTLEMLRSWPAHGKPVQSLAFSADGRWLATASADRTVAVWDWATGGEVRRFPNVISQYLPVAFHPKRPVLAYAKRDDIIVYAEVESGETLFERALFPDGEWLAWSPSKLFYQSSPRGDEHARLRFAGQIVPVYPLTLYRRELRHDSDLAMALPGPAPALAPKGFQRWWQHYPHKRAWYLGLSIVLAGWIGGRLRRGWISERRRRAQEAVSRQLLVSQEAERKRIAAELHDSLGQELLVIKNRLYLAQQPGPEAERAAQLEEISENVSRTLAEVRQISHNLRPYQLDRLGLTKAVQSVVRNVSESGALRLESDLADIDGVFEPEGEINFYRIVQESLNNIIKHADAATARLIIRRATGWLTLVVEDDGRGFDPRRTLHDPTRPRGFGMTGLGERARILGGRFDCKSAPSEGTRLTFEIPVPAKHGA